MRKGNTLISLAAIMVIAGALAAGVGMVQKKTRMESQAMDAVAVTFPQDHGAHPGFAAEWWYLNLLTRTTKTDGTDQRDLAYVLSFSRILGINNLLSSKYDNITKSFGENTDRDGSLVVQLVDGNRLFVQYSNDLTLATLEELVIGSDRKRVYHLTGRTVNIGSFNLTLKERTVVSSGFNTPLLWGGTTGNCQGKISVFSPDDTFYYSIPDLDITGSITDIGGVTRNVETGKSWFDHQWFNNSPPSDWQGHYWTNFHFTNSSNLYDPGSHQALGFVTQIYSSGPRYSYWVKRNSDGTNMCGTSGTVTIKSYGSTNYPNSWTVGNGFLDANGYSFSDNQIYQPPVGPKFIESASYYSGSVDGVPFTGLGFFETHLTYLPPSPTPTPTSCPAQSAPTVPNPTPAVCSATTMQVMMGAAPGAVSYTLYQQDVTAGSTLNWPGQTILNQTVSVISGHSYNFWTTATNSCGSVSGYSPTSWYTHPICPTPTPTPTSVPCASSGAPGNPLVSCYAAGNQATLTWSAVAGADYYSLRTDNLSNPWGPPASCFVSPENGSGPGDFCRQINGISYAFGVTPDQPYNWWVHSRVNCNPGYWGPASGGSFTCFSPQTPTPTPTRTPTPIPVTPTVIPTKTPTPQPTPTPTPSSTSITLYPTADTFVHKSYPSTNYGTESTLQVDGSPVKTVFVKFNLSSLAGKTISSAKFRFRITNSSSSTQKIRRVANTSWTETGLTYNNNRPALGTTVVSFPGGSSGTWKEVDITPAVKEKLGSTLSLGIDSSGSDGLDFYSKDSTSKPQLVVR